MEQDLSCTVPIPTEPGENDPAPSSTTFPPWSTTSSSSSMFRHLQSRSLGKESQLQGFATAKKNLWLLQRLRRLHTLDHHRGCVNSIVWNDSGSSILSGSDDHRLIVTNPYTNRVLADVATSHRANIFSAKFLPGSSDAKVVSCAGDGMLLFTDLERVEETRQCLFSCHSGTAYELLTMPEDAHTFLSCGEDGSVRWFDLRIKEKCDKSNCKEDILISAGSPVTSISLNPVVPYHLAVGASDSTVRVFDRRMLGTTAALGGELQTPQQRHKSLEGLLSRFSVPELEGKHRRITSVQYRPDGQEVLASFSSDYVYTFNPLLSDPSKSKRLFVGKNARSSNVGGGGGTSFTRSGAKAKVEPPVPPMKKLRLRGDWSDTGPNARPESEAGATAVAAPPTAVVRTPEQADAANAAAAAAARPGEEELGSLHGNLMQRMTDALSRMLNDPSTRIAMRRLQSSRASAATGAGGSTEEEGSDETPAAADQSSRTVSVEEDDEEEEAEEGQANENLEPEVSLRYGSRGTETSTVSITRTPASDSNPDNDIAAPSTEDDDVANPLPGPSQVVTHPGNSGHNPVTGQRQRRRGVSGPPTGASIDSPTLNVGQYQNITSKDIYEFVVGDGDDPPESECEEAREILQPAVIGKFIGHRNARTMIKEACWWGNDFILSGSDCGHVFGWQRSTGRLVLLLEADRHVVNCVRPHPFDPVLATSGIDYNVKIWTPSKEEAKFDQEAADMLVRRNEVMLEETRDTITVPATLMIRMLASLNQIRRAGRLIPRSMEQPQPQPDNSNDGGSPGNDEGEGNSSNSNNSSE